LYFIHPTQPATASYERVSPLREVCMSYLYTRSSHEVSLIEKKQ
jgi:hypothetical protein